MSSLRKREVIMKAKSKDEVAALYKELCSGKNYALKKQFPEMAKVAGCVSEEEFIKAYAEQKDTDWSQSEYSHLAVGLIGKNLYQH